MAEVVGGSFLSAFLQVFFDRMASREVLDFFKGQKLDYGLLKKLKITMISVNGVLDDAEEMQITKPAVKMWLDELKDAIYEADDLLDEIAFDSRRLDMEAAGSLIKDQVRNFFSSRIPFNKGRKEMEVKLEDVFERLEHLVKQKDALGLIEGIGGKPSSQKTTPLVDESGVFGRDDDKETLMKLLLSDDANGSSIGVIPIVGMGGIGKTTLAQLVYNYRRVQEMFDLKAWVCVSEEFDVSRVTEYILRRVTSVICDTKAPNERLRERLMGKKFLLVLDDFWNDKYADWDKLLIPLMSGAKGSKIMVTTRNESVALITQTVPTYRLKEITDNDCWLLFAKHAFNHRNCTAHLNSEKIGRQIVRKCKGLPLTAKTLGGLLHSKYDAKEWEKVLKSDFWDLSDDSILPALQLSYHYLPSRLKRCFAYCALFPKGYEFVKEELILLWMAEGFLIQPEGNTEMEEIGEEYFYDLASRSFFQQSSNRSSYFVMHDLMNDLAKFVAGEFCFRLEGDECNPTQRTRYLSYARTGYDGSKKFEGIYEVQLLRTFLPLSQGEWLCRIDNKVMDDLLPILRRLRVLSLSQYSNVVQLPNSFGNLKLLRYLNLSHTAIKVLPEIICTLYNLLSLLLYGCYVLVQLPTNMGRLINLHHLDLTQTKLQEMPPRIGRLTNLQTLTDFSLGKHSGSRIWELGELQNLRGTLRIWNLQNVIDAQDASEANLKGKKFLKKLELVWKGDVDNSLHQRAVLEQLHPHMNVEHLSIVGYGGTKFPDWVGNSSFSKLVSLKIRGCTYCSSLPTLGQLPSLKDLSISAFDAVVSVGPEFYGSCTSMKKPFGSLEILTFEMMPLWHEWVSYGNGDEGEAFPLLRELYIKNCPNLTKALPSHLPSLAKLEIRDCPVILASIPKAPAILEMMLKDNSSDMQLEKLPSGLHSLRVGQFLSPESLLQEMKQMASLLEVIVIEKCNSLKFFPLELFPKLESLCISECPSLQGLSATEATPKDFTSLNFLSIADCPNLVSFPNGGLPAPNLLELQLLCCSKLNSLPECMHFLLPSLVKLVIINCPTLESFPIGGLPSKLEILEIQMCSKLVSGSMQQDLRRLPSLSHLSIDICEDVESFPEKMQLPSTLSSLKIQNFENLKYLNYMGLQHLTSLRELEIENCPNLQSMPEEGLPYSLRQLCIYGCPLLEQRCQQEKGEDWLKISHIPYIRINYYLIRERRSLSCFKHPL